MRVVGMRTIAISCANWMVWIRPELSPPRGKQEQTELFFQPVARKPRLVRKNGSTERLAQPIATVDKQIKEEVKRRSKCGSDIRKLQLHPSNKWWGGKRSASSCRAEFFFSFLFFNTTATLKIWIWEADEIEWKGGFFSTFFFLQKKRKQRHDN